MADPAAVTNTFTASTLAQSAKVNENFQDLVDWVNTNAVHLDASKAFTQVPSGPASDPTTANQLTRKSYVDASVVPVGMITAFGGSSAPSRWALCDGSLLSRTTYSDLFAVIGTTYGAGDGSTTFQLPDLRARTPFGYKAADSAHGTLGGTGGVQDAIVPAHTHTATTGNPSADHTHTFSDTSTAAGGHSHTDEYGQNFLGINGTTQDTLMNGEGAGPETIKITGDVYETITSTVANHTHAVSGTTSGQSAVHTHTVTVNNTGVAVTDANLPPYQTVNFIIRTNVA